MDLKTFLIGSGGLVAFTFFIWVYNRKSIQEALRKRELNQQTDALIKNQKANERKSLRDKDRKKRIGNTVDPDNLWSGLRGQKTDSK